MSEKKYKKDEGTVIAYHRYVQGIISNRLNGAGLGPGYTPCRIAMYLLPLSLVFLTVGLFVIYLRPHHLYLIGVWPRFLGPFFVILFVLTFGASVFFYDLAIKKSNKFRRKLKFQGYGQYGAKVLHESHLEREKMIKEDYKSGTAPHKPKTQRQHRQGYPHRKGANDEGYEGTGERPREERRRREQPPRRVEGPDRRVYSDHPYSDQPPPSYSRYTDEGKRWGDDRHVHRGRDERVDEGRREKERQTRDDREQYDEGDGYSRVESSRAGRRGQEPQQYEKKERQPSVGSKYDQPQTGRFYEEHSQPVERADGHHVVSRRAAEPSQRYSERNIDEGVPMMTRGQPKYQIQFATDAEDSAV